MEQENPSIMSHVSIGVSDLEGHKIEAAVWDESAGAPA
jgi:hypothetical protein